MSQCHFSLLKLPNELIPSIIRHLGPEDVRQLFRIPPLRSKIQDLFTIVCDKEGIELQYFKEFKETYQVPITDINELCQGKHHVNMDKIYMVECQDQNTYNHNQELFETVTVDALAAFIYMPPIRTDYVTDFLKENEGETMERLLDEFPNLTLILYSKDKWLSIDDSFEFGFDANRLLLPLGIEKLSFTGTKFMEGSGMIYLGDHAVIETLSLKRTSEEALKVFDFTKVRNVYIDPPFTASAQEKYDISQRAINERHQRRHMNREDDDESSEDDDEVERLDIGDLYFDEDSIDWFDARESLQLDNINLSNATKGTFLGFQTLTNVIMPSMESLTISLVDKQQDLPYELSFETNGKLTSLEINHHSQTRIPELTIKGKLSNHLKILEIRSSDSTKKQGIKFTPECVVFDVEDLMALRCEGNLSMFKILDLKSGFKELVYLSFGVMNDAEVKLLKPVEFPKLVSCMFYNDNPNAKMAYPELKAPLLVELYLMSIASDVSMKGLEGQYPKLKALTVRLVKEKHSIRDWDTTLKNIEWMSLSCTNGSKDYLSMLTRINMPHLQIFDLELPTSLKPRSEDHIRFKSPILRSLKLSLGQQSQSYKLRIVDMRNLQKLAVRSNATELLFDMCPKLTVIIHLNESGPTSSSSSRPPLLSSIEELKDLEVVYLGNESQQTYDTAISRLKNFTSSQKRINIHQDMTRSQKKDLALRFLIDDYDENNHDDDDDDEDDNDDEWMETIGEEIYDQSEFVKLEHWHNALDAFKGWVLRSQDNNSEDNQ